MKRTRLMLPFADMWRPLIIGAVMFLALGAVLTFNLGSLTPGLSAAETVQRDSSSSATEILNNPLFLHHKAGMFIAQKTGQDHAAALRLPSAAVAVLIVVSMFSLLKFWYTWRVALLGSLLLVTSSWFLSVSRLASADINFALPFVLAVGGVWLFKKRLTFITGLFLSLVAVVLLYVPGMIWLFLAAAIWQRQTIKRLIRQMPVLWQTVFISVSILGLAPLVWSFTQNGQLLRTWLGMPITWPESIGAYLYNIVEIPLNLFIRSAQDPVRNLGRLPLLDAFTSAMVGLGIFASFFRLGLDRTKLVIGSGIIGSLLIGLGGPVSIAFLLPHVYVLAASGIALMLQQWLTVFPRNPFARWLGITLVSASVLLAGYYHLNRYFIAWPKAPETKAIFRQQG